MISLDEPEWERPVRGEVYLVSETVRTTGDYTTRPAVVMLVPASVHGRIWIVTRTTDEEASGHPSPQDIPNGLTWPGVWSVKDEVEAVLWCKPQVERLKKVLDIFDLGDIAKALRIDWGAS